MKVLGLAMMLLSVNRLYGEPCGPSAPKEGVAEFLREALNIADRIEMSVGDFESSPISCFVKTQVLVGNGDRKKTLTVSVATDNSYLILGDVQPLPDGIVSAEVVRKAMHLPESAVISVGELQKSIFKPFLKFTVSLSGTEVLQPLYISSERRHLIAGLIFPFKKAVYVDAATLTHGYSYGPANAPVEIIEYSDLQCPACARADEFLRETVAKKYGAKVRFLYAEYPLMQLHDWAALGATASQCVQQLKPDAVVAFRSAVYSNQKKINRNNAREQLASLAEQEGVHSSDFASCMDRPEAFEGVKQQIEDGKKLEIVTTPTFVINGQLMPGLPKPERFLNAVDSVLLPTGLCCSILPK
jgi:protein-disulfide isomerase